MKWAFYASGFRESRGKHTGTKANARAVRDVYQSNDCCVIYVEWNDEPKKYARDVASQWEAGDTLIVTGYSWGAGNWVKKFLWELWKQNPDIVVSHLTLVDPVVRMRFPLLRWFAITDWGTISYPENAQKAVVFYQRVDEPNASKLAWEGGITASYSKLDYPHTKIDNAPEVTELVLRVARDYLMG